MYYVDAAIFFCALLFVGIVFALRRRFRRALQDYTYGPPETATPGDELLEAPANPEVEERRRIMDRAFDSLFFATRNIWRRQRRL